VTECLLRNGWPGLFLGGGGGGWRFLFFLDVCVVNKCFMRRGGGGFLGGGGGDVADFVCCDIDTMSGILSTSYLAGICLTS